MKKRYEQDIINDMIGHEMDMILARIRDDANRNGICKKHHIVLTASGMCFSCEQEQKEGDK